MKERKELYYIIIKKNNLLSKNQLEMKFLNNCLELIIC